MIVCFRDSEAERLFNRESSRKIPADIQRAALRKLLMIDAAHQISDLSIPPGNRLEQLRGKRKGQWSVRSTDQWRICFEWKGNNAYNVEIVDYHD